MFHPAGGNTSAYEALLKRLPDDQPVIGFDRGVEGPIDERVREYLPKLREVQPHGPYVLVGWSFGGALAYGVAQLLREAGEEVAFIGLIDVVRPKEDLVETPESKRERLERWKDFAIPQLRPRRRCADPDGPPGGGGRRGQFQIIMEMMAMSNTKIPGGIIEHQRTSFIENRILDQIEPVHYDGKVVLYRADRMHDGAIELEPGGPRSTRTVDGARSSTIWRSSTSAVITCRSSMSLSSARSARISPSACLTSASEGTSRMSQTTAEKLADLREKAGGLKEPAGEKRSPSGRPRGILSPRERLNLLFDPGRSSRLAPWRRCPVPPIPVTGTVSSPVTDGQRPSGCGIQPRPVGDGRHRRRDVRP